MTEQEMLEAMKTLLYPINNKLDNIDLQLKAMDAKITTLDLRVTNLENQVKKGFRKSDQDTETLVKVLELKGILPKAQ